MGAGNTRNSKKFRVILVFFGSGFWKNRSTLLNDANFSTGRKSHPMETWMHADIDNIVRDFVDQFQTAVKEGWQETRPAHYRAIVAALESALRERHALSGAQAAARLGEPEPAAVSVTAPLPWTWRRSPELLPVSHGHA
jgi:hypothetical protein